MSKFQTRTIYILSVLLLFVLLGGPQMAQAWALPPQQQATSPEQQQSSAQQQQGVTANANDAAQPLPNAPSQEQSRAKQKDKVPVGAAAAEAGVTAGGAASRPAGSAIAPAKQGQKRSLLIKLGLIAAAGGAIGAVYALSRGTGSLPPGATR
jgi:cytoskeletal protein RodZ